MRALRSPLSGPDLSDLEVRQLRLQQRANLFRVGRAQDHVLQEALRGDAHEALATTAAFYSARIAITGSTRVALHAGTKLATSPTTSSVVVTNA